MFYWYGVNKIRHQKKCSWKNINLHRQKQVKNGYAEQKSWAPVHFVMLAVECGSSKIAESQAERPFPGIAEHSVSP